MVASLIFVFAVLPQIFATVGAEYIGSSYKQEPYYCEIPPHPEHGNYKVVNYPNAVPGERYSSIKLDISCDTGYLSNNSIKSIYCVHGDWTATTCAQEISACGLTTTLQQQLDGTSITHLQLPWHTVIYRKDCDERFYGSLITETKIISAAHCLHNYKDELLPVSVFVVYSSINDTRDRNRQLSEVIDIKVPSNYRGSAKNYEDDIAIVVVKTPFFFHLSVRPVCLDFNNDLDRTQLTEGNSGKTVVWSVDSERLDVLNVLDIPKNEDCENLLTTSRSPHLTKDKFCARYDGGWGNAPKTGSGLVFFESTTQRYYLRGVQSDLYEGRGGRINTWIVLYTSIMKHKDFIKQHL